MYFFCLAMLGLCYCQGASLVAESGGCSQVMGHRLLTAVVLLLQSMGSRVRGLQQLRVTGSRL